MILDLQPAKGHRILMQTEPGWIHSGTDFFVTDAGLVGAETTIGGFNGFDEKGIPEFVRMRRATQDASSIDGWCTIMKKGNNGGYANAWLLGERQHPGDRAARARFEVCPSGEEKGGLLYRLQRRRRPQDPAVRDQSARDRYPPFLRCPAGSLEAAHGAEYAGKIDLEQAKAFEADHFDCYLQKDRPGGRCLCGHDDLDLETYSMRIPFMPMGTIDGKVVDARMAKRMSFAARWGPRAVPPLTRKHFSQPHPQFDWMRGILKSRPSRPWTEFREAKEDQTPITFEKNYGYRP